MSQCGIDPVPPVLWGLQGPTQGYENSYFDLTKFRLTPSPPLFFFWFRTMGKIFPTPCAKWGIFPYFAQAPLPSLPGMSGESVHKFANITRILTRSVPMKSSHSGLFIGATLVKIRAILVEL